MIFLKHYNEGKSIPLEEKPLGIVRYPELQFILLNSRNATIFIVFMILKNTSMNFWEM